MFKVLTPTVQLLSEGTLSRLPLEGTKTNQQTPAGAFASRGLLHSHLHTSTHRPYDYLEETLIKRQNQDDLLPLSLLATCGIICHRREGDLQIKHPPTSASRHFGTNSHSLVSLLILLYVSPASTFQAGGLPPLLPTALRTARAHPAQG